MSTAARNAASISKCVVSSKCASGAGFNGAVVRPVSRSSRRRMSARIVGLIDGTAACPHFGRSPAGPRLRARGDEDLHLGVREDDGADVAAVEHRPRAGAAEISLEGKQRLAHRAEYWKSARRLPRWRGLSAAARRTGRNRAPAPPRRPARDHRARGRHRGVPSPRRGRSDRYRGAATRNAAASRLPSVPLPDAGGPSMAMIIGRGSQLTKAAQHPSERTLFREASCSQTSALRAPTSRRDCRPAATARSARQTPAARRCRAPRSPRAS